MTSVPSRPNPIQAQVLSASLTSNQDSTAEIDKAKQAASTDGLHNLIVVNSDSDEHKLVYHLAVNEMDFDQVSLGQRVSTGKIEGTIHFMDHGKDDIVTPTKAADTESLPASEAAEFIQALTVWGFGSEEDEDKFSLAYSPREQQELLTQFQTEIGAEATGVWNSETFGKAKQFLMKEFDEEETLTDAQFKQFMGDLNHYRNGSLDRNQVNDNLEAYVYDLRQTPLHIPPGSDVNGFNQAQSQIQGDDRLYMTLAMADFDAESSHTMVELMAGRLSTEQKDAFLADNFMPEEIAELKAAPDLGQKMQTMVIKEFQQSLLDMPTDAASGQFDQATYDALQTYLRNDFDLDIQAEDLRELTNQTLLNFVAVGRGQMSYDDMEAQVEKHSAP